MNLRTFPALSVGLLLSSAAAPIAADAAAAKCVRGWTGTVQYVKNQSNSRTKSEPRISGKGTETTSWSMTNNYAAKISVRAGVQPGSSAGRAVVNYALVSSENKSSTSEFFCPRERSPRIMSGNFTSQSETRADASGVPADVNVNVNPDGTYSVSVQLPAIKGTASSSSSSTFSGQCYPKPGKSNSTPGTPVSVDGVSLSSDGKNRIQPSDPNRLSGSYSSTYSDVTETITWNLRRCGGDLRIVDVKFEDMRFPNWGAWKEIVEETGTIDGNRVLIKAIVANDGAEDKSVTVKFRDTYKGDKYNGAKADGLLDEVGANIPAGEEREVMFEWDSSGYAWFDDGRPRLVQRIKAELEVDDKKIEDMTRNLKVAPKPLVLVHGLWSNWTAWQLWQNILTSSHSYDWKAFPVGEKAQYGKMNTGEAMGELGPTNTIAENAEELRRYINYAQEDRNAWHVDLVAHSMGGLISRRYIHASMPAYPDGKPQVSHLVMLGTPNMGSRCADLISAPLEAAGRSMDALRELRPSVVAKFNAVHTERKNVEFSVLAGNPLPTVCYMFDPNDGVVAVPSAIWTIADHEQQSVLHTDMATTAGFASFVKPRIAIGPAKFAAARKLSALVPAAGAFRTPSARLMILGAEGPAQPSQPDPMSKMLWVAPKQTTDIKIPVEDASNLGLTFVTSSKVSATLIDDSGAVAGSNLAGTPEANQIFRSLFVNRPVRKGQWTLQLKNEAELDQEVVMSIWFDAK